MTNKIAFIGDSLTDPLFNPGSGGPTVSQHWTSILGAAAGYAPADILTFAASGETTDQGLLRVPAVISAAPAVCVVMLMANDRASVPIARYETNLRSMVTQMQDAGIKVVLASCPAWRSGIIDYKPFMNVMQAIAIERGCRYFDVFKEYIYSNYADGALAVTWYFNTTDPIHQSIAGNARIAALLGAWIPTGAFSPDVPAGGVDELTAALADLAKHGATVARLGRVQAAL